MSNVARFFLLTFALVVFVVLSICIGTVTISPRDLFQALLDPHSNGVSAMILWQMRLPRTIAAMISGSGLAVAGLLMQTVFRNILAGPYVLGISSGASLGVATVLLLGVGAGSVWGILSAATLGAGCVMILVLWLARFSRSPLSLLVLGLMVGYLVDALVSLLIHFGNPDRLQAFVNWGFGSFGRVSWNDLPFLGGFVFVGIFATIFCLKYLNTVLLGESAAQSLGIAVRSDRFIALGAASIITAVVTVYCGPIGFLGLAVPHLVRALFGTANHRILIPGCIIAGAGLAVTAGWIANLPSQGGVLPLNAITALIGVPVVFWALLRGHGRMDG
jgi:iron complex transport system permease protein